MGEVTDLNGATGSALGSHHEGADRTERSHQALVPGSSKTGSREPWAPAITVLALLGVALIIMPFAFTMFSRAPKGAAMLKEFRPFMTTARLNGFQEDIRQINAGVQEAGTGVATFLTAGLGAAE